MVQVFVDWSYHNEVITLYKILYKIHFCTKFYNGFVWKIATCAIMPGFRKSSHISAVVHISEVHNFWKACAIKRPTFSVCNMGRGDIR